MNEEDLYQIIENNKNVSFVKKIISKVFHHKLFVSEHNEKFIVHPGSIYLALKKNNFVEFDSQADAEWFVSNYKKYHEERAPTEMNQKQFEQWREKKRAKWKYVGRISGGKFWGIVEKLNDDI